MSVREITVNPAGQKGYALFLEQPNNHVPVVYVFTEDYIRYVLVRQNMQIATQLGITYNPPQDGNPAQIVEWLNSIYRAQNWVDRQPHMVELVDVLNDFKISETDMNKAIVAVPKRYNIMFGAMLEPWYPELVASPRVPLPASPM